MTKLEKVLIVNADDFGLTAGVNAGIIRAHEEGIVTSTSLMVRGGAVAEAVEYARAHPRLGVGLHVDLCEWCYVDGEWKLAYEVVPFQDARAVAAEVCRQIEVFRNLMGCDPDHLDSHQHVHRDEPLWSILKQHSAALGLVLRHADSQVNYCGVFYGQSDKGYAYHEGITVDALVEIVRGLSPGTTELCCHPGLGDDLDSVYRVERYIECATLCDKRVVDVVKNEGVRLSTFKDR